MSTEYATLARYIQQIAVQAPEIKSTLKTLRARGVIPGIYTEAGGIQDDERETCCDPENNGVIEDDPDARNPWTGEDGNAPPEYQSTPEGVTDCETGEAISVNFVGGFSLAETCKECGPDETWREGWYWRIFQTPNEYLGSTVTEAATKWVDGEFDLADSNFFLESYAIGIPTSELANIIVYGNAVIAVRRVVIATGVTTITNYSVPISNRSCTAFPEEPYCSITKAPEVCGDDWESDSTTQYTLRNGCLVASKCDPDAPTSALGCNEELTLCQGGVPWAFRPTSDGGWIQYDPDGIRTGGKYDGRTGKRTAVIPPGQESMY